LRVAAETFFSFTPTVGGAWFDILFLLAHNLLLLLPWVPRQAQESTGKLERFLRGEHQST
jgi:hypothetical protein